MEFSFETVYNQKAVTAMAKALRKTVRKKRSLRSHIFGWLVIILTVLFTIPLGDQELVLNFRTVITWLAGLVILFALLFEDRLNGYVARKRMLAGMGKASTLFGDEGYISTTEIGKTEFQYRNIDLLVETTDYFVFVFGKNYAQVYDKSMLSGGTEEEFRKFISEKTGKQIFQL